MKEQKFRALVVSENSSGEFLQKIELQDLEDLPDEDVLIKVSFSSLNYKDALSFSGNKGVTKKYPHTPGIDAAGVVVKDSSHEFIKGQEVLVTGYDLGMNTPGGFGRYIKVPSSWVVPLPKNLSLKNSMVWGTAGFTAALGVYKLTEVHGIKPDSGKILVTGATGGVGILACGILAKLGYDVEAVSGKEKYYDTLKSLGVKSVIGRSEVVDGSLKGLLKGRWIGVFDTVGGDVLSTVIRSIRDSGAACCCGNIKGGFFNASIYPFIIRDITLYGLASADTPIDLRKKIWSRLENKYMFKKFDQIYKTIPLEETFLEVDKILQGHHFGRVVVKLDD